MFKIFYRNVWHENKICSRDQWNPESRKVLTGLVLVHFALACGSEKEELLNHQTWEWAEMDRGKESFYMKQNTATPLSLKTNILQCIWALKMLCEYKHREHCVTVLKTTYVCFMTERMKHDCALMHFMIWKFGDNMLWQSFRVRKQ